ncbi:hypothetical protein FB107DRAFT_273499 [Schizophyllum commune]
MHDPLSSVDAAHARDAAFAPCLPSGAYPRASFAALRVHIFGGQSATYVVGLMKTDLVIEALEVGSVDRGDAGEGSAPAAAADNRDLLQLCGRLRAGLLSWGGRPIERLSMFGLELPARADCGYPDALRAQCAEKTACMHLENIDLSFDADMDVLPSLTPSDLSVTHPNAVDSPINS